MLRSPIIEMSLAKTRDLGFEFQAANLNQLENSTNVTRYRRHEFRQHRDRDATGPAALGVR